MIGIYMYSSFLKHAAGTSAVRQISKIRSSASSVCLSVLRFTYRKTVFVYTITSTHKSICLLTNEQFKAAKVYHFTPLIHHMYK